MGATNLVALITHIYEILFLLCKDWFKCVAPSDVTFAH